MSQQIIQILLVSLYPLSFVFFGITTSIYSKIKETKRLKSLGYSKEKIKSIKKAEKERISLIYY